MFTKLLIIIIMVKHEIILYLSEGKMTNVLSKILPKRLYETARRQLVAVLLHGLLNK